MSEYYYLIASLPAIGYDSEKTITIDAFLATCSEQLKSGDMEILKNAGIRNLEDTDTTCRSLYKWREWEKNLRNQLAELRSRRKGLDPDQYKRKCREFIDLKEFSQNVFNQESPLAAEEMLNKARWSYLDDLEFGHYFDMDRLVIYYLKLQLLVRKGLFEYKRGNSNFTSLSEYTPD